MALMIPSPSISLHAAIPRNQRLTCSLNINRQIPMASTWNISKSLSLHAANPRNQRLTSSPNPNQEGNGKKVTIKFQIKTPLVKPSSMILLWSPTGSMSMAQDGMLWNEEGYWFTEVKVNKDTDLDYWLRPDQGQFTLQCRGSVLANWDKTIRGRWTREDGFKPEADGVSDQGRVLAKKKVNRKRLRIEADSKIPPKEDLKKRKSLTKRMLRAKGKSRKAVP